jgi:tRNA/rRNA methyltransferase
VLRIPTDPTYGSLNLASAVQVIAYEWRLALGGYPTPDTVAEPKQADAGQIAGLLSHWEQSLQAIGYLDPQAPKKLMPRLQQLFNRADLTEEEVHILRGIAKAMQQPKQRKVRLDP